MVERLLFCNHCKSNTVHVDHSWLPAAVVCKGCGMMTEYDDSVFEDKTGVGNSEVEFYGGEKNFDK
jgi:transcription elongation factor Elf1